MLFKNRTFKNQKSDIVAPKLTILAICANQRSLINFYSFFTLKKQKYSSKSPLQTAKKGSEKYPAVVEINAK